MTSLLINPLNTWAQEINLNLETATIKEINAAFRANALTSERLVKLYLKRIETYDQQGPHLNTIITLNPQALSKARELDKERQKSGPRSLLHGIPIVVKDLLDTYHNHWKSDNLYCYPYYLHTKDHLTLTID